MWGRVLLAVVAVFVTWTAVDFVIHGWLLMDDYQATASLWRAQEEMMMWMIHVAVFVSAAVFVLIYALYFGTKTLASATVYGLLFGIAAGISMGYGSYAVMPITYKIAAVWFHGQVIEGIAGGIVLGLIVRD